MITIRRILALAMLPALLGAAPPATKFHREILRRGQGTEVVIVPIDGPIYESTRDGFPDVRVVDDRGEEVPYYLGPFLHQKQVDVKEVVPSQVVSLNPVEGGPLEVTVKLADGASEPDSATIHTPLTDFERRVRVLGSRDGESWTPLTEGRIFDYSRYMSLRDVEVRFSARGFRWFRFVLDREADDRRSLLSELIRTRDEQGGERRTEVEGILRRPFRIDRIELQQTVMRPGAGVAEPALKASLVVTGVETDREVRQTRVEVDGRRLPLRRLRLLTGSRNFRRSARVQAMVDGTWREVGSGDLLLYQLGEYHRESMTLDVWTGKNTWRAGRLRLVVDDNDEPPLDVVGVDGLYDEYRLEFVAEKGRNYHLDYGSEMLGEPRYDQEIVTEALAKHREREVAALGDPVRDPDYRPENLQTPKGVPAWLLILALALMTLVLAWAVVQAVRRAEKTPMDDFDA
ncbi:hypothetical protein [Paludisphaera rhizosphaerae]|uniref:hypothetical protein n=1 Tax=Paludisphaera rhizosphaerae TaxID=2711216 RepID=UPI0013ED720B|nr:hypothetical protein [Paludisphaera rhizosphaerae]